MDTSKVVTGLLLIVASSAILFAAGPVETAVPTLGLSVAALALAAGTLLVGTSRTEGRQV